MTSVAINSGTKARVRLSDGMAHERVGELCHSRTWCSQTVRSDNRKSPVYSQGDQLRAWTAVQKKSFQ